MAHWVREEMGLNSLSACAALLLRNNQGSAMDSTSSYVRSNLLKLLTIMSASGSGGFESVLNALDNQRVSEWSLRPALRRLVGSVTGSEVVMGWHDGALASPECLAVDGDWCPLKDQEQ